MSLRSSQLSTLSTEDCASARRIDLETDLRRDYLRWAVSDLFRVFLGSHIQREQLRAIPTPVMVSIGVFSVPLKKLIKAKHGKW